MPPGAASLSVAFAAAGRGSLFPCSAQLSLPLCPEQRSATFFLSFFPVQRSAPFSRALSHAMKWSFFTPFFPGSEAQDFQRLPRFCKNRHPPPPSISRLRAYTQSGRRLFDALLGEWHLQWSEILAAAKSRLAIQPACNRHMLNTVVS